MSKCYSAQGPSASGTATKTALNLRSTANLRVGVYHNFVGPFIGPNSTDFNVLVRMFRSTGQGTSAASAPTPIAIDGGDIPSLVVVEWTNSGEPTYATSPIASMPCNQRASPQWQAYDGHFCWSVAGATAGIGTQMVSTTPSTTWQIDDTMFWTE